MAANGFVRVVMRFTVPLGIAAFWGGLMVAAHVYPVGYDWRHQVLSELLDPNYDPVGYLWGCGALVACGVAGVAWTAALSADRVDLWLLRSGFLCMSFVALPDRVIPLPKGHELFAIVAFLGIGVGMIREMITADDADRLPDPQRRLAVLQSSLSAAMLLLALSLIGVTLAYLTLVGRNSAWLAAIWRAPRVSQYLRLGPWEWIDCAAFSVGLLLLWQRLPGRWKY